MDNSKDNSDSIHSDTSQNHENGENSAIFNNIHQFTTKNDSSVS